MEAPDKIYVTEGMLFMTNPEITLQGNGNKIEYTRTDIFIERVINFLNYKLDNIVATRVPGSIIPHYIIKQELIEDLKKYIDE